jgi:alpha-tubulin suppressor-like RCC1 family protein
MTAGTLGGSLADIVVKGSDVTGNGIINLFGGTFRLEGTGSFGGATDWTFNNLIFGDGTTSATTTKSGANMVTCSGNLTIANNHTLAAGTGIWNLAWGVLGNTYYLTGVTQISAGYSHTLALKSDGTVFAWGYNGYGRLGDNTTTDRWIPVQVLGVGGAGYLTGITQVSAGESHSLALKNDGTVFAWGYNGNGTLGNNTNNYSYLPVQVLGVGASGYLTGITQNSAGGAHTLA